MLVLILILIALVMWLVPMKPFIEKFFSVVAVVALLLWLLTIFGVLGRLNVGP